MTTDRDSLIQRIADLIGRYEGRDASEPADPNALAQAILAEVERESTDMTECP